MPIYEYRCRRCRKRSQVLTLRSSEVPDARCEHCDSVEVDRLMSRFAVARSEEARLDALGDPANLSGLDESDPRSMARWMRKMGKELGEDMAGPEFDEMVNELESGGLDRDDDGGDGGGGSGDGGDGTGDV
jgi:putative FmdB family regulatory protein